MRPSTAGTILRTKLYIPPRQAALVPRPRLIEALNQGRKRQLTLVAAPAGYGKTTLLSEWVHQAGLPIAWLSLDKGDNDPARFLTYLVAALQSIDPGIGGGILDGLHASRSPSLEPFLTQLINDVDAESSPFLFILDDYHQIELDTVHRAMTFLLEHMPPHMHLVIASRVDPPLPLARLRGRGQLTELRSGDLRFTPEEAAGFLTQVMGLALQEQEINLLTSRTEGWIVGLQLAAVSMKDREDQTAFVAAFSGSHEYIVDYLTDEVLKKQPERLRTFLLQTSILDRLTGSLCDAVTGQDEGQLTLERLREANLFLVPLDDERRWFRYHALFADMLHKRLKLAQPDLMPILHGRASDWFYQNGQVPTAVDHALAAKDFDRATAIVEQIAEETLIRTENATFLRWVEALPEKMVRSRPQLCVFHAGALLMSGRDLETVESLLHDAHEADTTGTVAGEVAVFRALIAMLQGDVKTSVDLSNTAFETLPADNLFMRSLVAGNLGIAYMSSGDVVAARKVFEEAARVGRQAGSIMSSVMATRRSAELSIIQGQLHEAWSVCERGLTIAVDGQGNPVPIAGVIKTVQAELLREWNDLEASRQHLEKSIELVMRWGEIMAIDDYVSLARVKQAQGDKAGAQEAMAKAQRIAGRSDASQVAPIIVALHQARLWVVQGNLEAAVRWMTAYQKRREQLSWEDESLYFHLRELADITLARVSIAQRRPKQALRIVDDLLPTSRRLQRMGSVIEILVLQALAFQDDGDVERALGALAEALSLAQPEGYVRTFVDEGEPMRALLFSALTNREIVRGDTSTEFPMAYIKKLLSVLHAETREMREPPRKASSPTMEPLSNRELEVLRLLTTDLTSAEIADDLFISANTARFHIKNIYGKLGVHSRAEAIARAMELGFL